MSYIDKIKLLSKHMMKSEKIVAIITGAVSIFLAIAYLSLVQLLDIRGKMIPALNFDNEQISIHEVVNN